MMMFVNSFFFQDRHIEIVNDPFNKRPSHDYLHHFVKKKILTRDM